MSKKILLNNKEDAELVYNAQRDKQEYEKLYQKYAERVYRYIWFRAGRSKETAEDLMHETFLKGFRGLRTFQVHGYSYLTYLLRIAHNLLVNRYRKPTDIALSPRQDEIAEELEDFGRAIDVRNEVEQLRTVIKKLPKYEQQLIEWRYEQELSIREIAHKLGKSENAVKLALSRARKRLLNEVIRSGGVFRG